MANIAWKVINGYGPYAYLQQSVRVGKTVISKHLQYLGAAGSGSMMRPGKSISYQGDPVFAPPFPEELLEKLKDGPKEKLLGATSTAPKSVQRATDDAISSVADIPIEGVPATSKGVSPRRPSATPAEIALVIEHPDVIAAKAQDRLDVAVALVQSVKSKKVTAKQIAAFAKHPKVTDAPAKEQLKVAKGLAERQALLDLSVGAKQVRPVAQAAKKAAVSQLAAGLTAIAGNKVFSEKKAVVQSTIMQPAPNGTKWTLPDGKQVVKVKLGQFTTDGGQSIKSSQSALATITTVDQLGKFVTSAVTPPDDALALLDSKDLTASTTMKAAPKGTIWTLPNGEKVVKLGISQFVVGSGAITGPLTSLNSIGTPNDLQNFVDSEVKPTASGETNPFGQALQNDANFALSGAPIDTVWKLSEGSRIKKVGAFSFTLDGGEPMFVADVLKQLDAKDHAEILAPSAPVAQKAPDLALPSSVITAKELMEGSPIGTKWILPTGENVEKIDSKSFIVGLNGPITGATAVIQDLNENDLSKFLGSVLTGAGEPIDVLSKNAAMKNLQSAETNTTWTLPSGDKVVKVGTGQFSVSGDSFVGPEKAMETIKTQASLTKFLGSETLIIDIGASKELTQRQKLDAQKQMDLAIPGSVLNIPPFGSGTSDFIGDWTKTSDSGVSPGDWEKPLGDTPLVKSTAQLVNSLAFKKSFNAVKANVDALPIPSGRVSQQAPDLAGPTAKQKLDLEDQMNLASPGSVLTIPKTAPFSLHAGDWEKVSPSATGPFGSKWSKIESLATASSQELIASSAVINNFDAVKANADALAKPSTGAIAFGDVDKMTTAQALKFAENHDSIKHVFGQLATKLSEKKTEDEFNDVWKGFITGQNLAIDAADPGAAVALGFQDADTWKSLMSKASTAVYFFELNKAKADGKFTNRSPEKSKLMSFSDVENIKGPAALAVAKQTGPLTANPLDLLRNDLDILDTPFADAATIGQIKDSLKIKFQAWGDATTASIIAGGNSQAASAGFGDVDARLKLTMEAGAELFTQALAANGLISQAAADTAGAATVKAVTAPKITNIPKLGNGKPAIGKINVKKLEAAAAKGVEALEIAEDQILENLLAKSKKAAVSNAVMDLLDQLKGQTPTQEGSGDSGQAEILEKVATGDQKLPTQSTPSKAAQKAQEKALLADNKNWDADLEKIAGQKGSNEGGLYKDKKVDLLYYVKWSGDSRARIESLASDLYGMAGVPTADTRVITMAGKTAIASEWIPDVQALTIDDMSKRADVRENFVVDAWLGNWDVVGLQADNIVVSKDGGTAYRIDPGGSLIFRAQGKVKDFSPFVPELSSMRTPGTAPQAAQVFTDLSDKELKVGAAKVAAISEQDIDEAVDRAALPAKIDGQDFGPTLSEFLKARLKARRNVIIEDVLNFVPPKPLTVKDLKKVSKLDEASLQLIIDNKDALQPSGSFSADTAREKVHDPIIKNQIGGAKGDAAAAALTKAWKRWKGDTDNAPSSILRWAGAEVRGRGDDEIAALERFWKFTGQEVEKKSAFQKEMAAVGNDVLAGMAVSDKMNTALIMALKNPIATTPTGKQKKKVKQVTVYRRWEADQVKHLGWSGAKVGDKLLFDDPTFFSWSLASNVFANVYHGQIRVKAKIPIDQIEITDRINPGGLPSEDEVLFCCPVTEMTVTKAP